jgi:hypothetical protein
MSDLELIELAAKAAGIEPCRLHDDIGDNGGIETPAWNPLIDDGAALRLAVQLHIAFDYGPNFVEVVKAIGPGNVVIVREGGADTLAATRRVIVRAAADIGKAMK